MFPLPSSAPLPTSAGYNGLEHQVKTFETQNPAQLEQQVNEFLENLELDTANVYFIGAIHFSSGGIQARSWFSAMIHYVRLTVT